MLSNVTLYRLPKWQDSNRLRGYGHVEFPTADLAAKALEMDGKSMEIISLYYLYCFISNIHGRLRLAGKVYKSSQTHDP